jgi:guanylate kinase
LEINGVKSIKKIDPLAKFIFIQPPSLTVLEERLRSRGTDSDEVIKKRISYAQEALDFANVNGNYDCIIINNDLDDAFKKLEEYVVANWPLK